MIKLMFIILSCFFYELSFAQIQAENNGQKGGKESVSQQQALEKELMDLIQQGVDSNLISPELRDSIMIFIRNTNVLSSGKFYNFSKLANGGVYDILPPNKKIVIRDGIPIVVDTTLSGPNVSNEKLELSLEKKPEQSLDYSASRNVKNGVNTTMLFPDKLPVPERGAKSKYEYMTQEQLKQKILRIDYFSKGLDGYYKKLIAMGYVGQGWEETREVREAMDRLRTSIMTNLSGGVPPPSEPGFIRRMSSSNNPFMNVLGGLLRMLNHGAGAQIRHGYTNPNYMIVTPPVGTMNNPSTK